MDPIVCELVRSSIEPLLDDMKPPIIAKMGFQRLTLGVSRFVCFGRGGGKRVESFAPYYR
jgi:hypothetical protein